MIRFIFLKIKHSQQKASFISLILFLKLAHRLAIFIVSYTKSYLAFHIFYYQEYHLLRIIEQKFPTSTK